MEFIAIDIGTSFTKGAIVDSESLGIRGVRRMPGPARLIGSEPLFQEYSPLEFVESVTDIVAELLPSTSACRGILLTGQMGGLVFCDNKGQPLSPYVSWLDGRATLPHPGGKGTFIERLAVELGERTSCVLGNEFRPGLPLSFLYWLKESQQLRQFEGAIPVTLPDFVAAALCQQKPVMELTNAAGLVDVQSSKLPFELFEELKLNRLHWPTLVDFRHCVGEHKSSGSSLPVFAATGDHQCSLAGTLLQTGELSVNIATGSQLTMLTEERHANSYQLRPYFDGAYLKTITNIPAGRALSAMMKLLTEMTGADVTNPKQAWDYFFQQAEQTPESDININLAFFPGAVSGPGSLSNLREDNLTVGHVARACLEQMADYYHKLAAQLAPSKNWSNILFSGGICQQSDLLKQLISTRLESKARAVTSSEDALFGMMVLGRVIGGLNATVAEATEHVSRHTTAD